MDLLKQAVFDYQKRQKVFDLELSELIEQVDLIREEHPGCGVEKMYDTLLPNIMGRDKFCEIFMSLGYRVRRVRNYHRTTIPTHIKYPNLIEGMQVTQPFQVIQSDITYYDLHGKFYYIVFIIDVYTREILSHCTSNNMRKEANIKALQEAIKKMKYNEWGCIHHSDRGAQYASNKYLKLLTDNKIHASMGLIAQDNAYAERVNGTIKNEYLKKWKIDNEQQLKNKIYKAVEQYNKKKKHNAYKK